MRYTTTITLVLAGACALPPPRAPEAEFLVSAGDQWLPAVLYVAPEVGLNDLPSSVLGTATVRADSNVIVPLFPISIYPSMGFDGRLAELRNADNTGTRQTGYPRVPNSFPLIPNSGLHVGPGLVQVK